MVAALCVATAWGLLRRRPFRFLVEGESMSPALLPGDWVVAMRANPADLRVGRVVVARPPARPGLEVVKRLAAGPEDLAPTGDRLGPNEWFLLGDRPESSTDSRHFGPVPARAVVGVAWAVYWPPRRARRLRAFAGVAVRQ